MRRCDLAAVLLLVLLLVGRARTADPGPPTPIPQDGTDLLTTESLEGRGSAKFGDHCETTRECGFRGSVCDANKKSCQCLPELPATNHIDKCGKEVDINESCFFDEQCENRVLRTVCKDGRCLCRFEMTPVFNKLNKVECIALYEPPEQLRYVDPAMIMVLVIMTLMFIIICVVLRLFSKARWRENRTIFNTPNPRLMNVSLLREVKHPGTEQRRGSKGSNNRPPSRHPSMSSLRPQSPSAASQAVA